MNDLISREEAIEKLKEYVTDMECDIYYGSQWGVPKEDIEDAVNECTTVKAITIDRLAEIMAEKFNYQFMSYYSKKDWKKFFEHYAEVEDGQNVSSKNG